MRKLGFSRTTVVYVLALAFIAAMAIGTHLVVDAIVSRQMDMAHIVNISGRQRMLSQRIAGLALRLAVEEAGRRPALERAMADATALMARTHETLRRVDDHGPGPAVRAVFTDEPHRLDERMAAFLGLARRYLALPADARAGAPELAALQEQAFRPVLDALDAQVRARQEESEAAIVELRRTLLLMLGAMLVSLAAEALFVFRPLFRRLGAAQSELMVLATTDPLTGCLNRRFALDSATREFERLKRYGGRAVVLMLDIDHFKAINDRHGHPVGDEAIRVLVGTVVANIRTTDVFGRFGGEEFILLLHQADLDQGTAVAEKLRTLIAAAPVPLPGGSLTMTVSIGVATVSAGDHTVFDTIGRADQALYQAKDAGRNRVAVCPRERGEGAAAQAMPSVARASGET